MSGFFNRGCAEGFRHWYPRVLRNCRCSIEKLKLRPTFAVTRHVVQADSRSKMYLQSCPNTRTRPHSRPQILALWASGVPSKDGFHELSELLQRVPLYWKGWKTLQYAVASIGHSLYLDSNSQTTYIHSFCVFRITYRHCGIYCMRASHQKA